MSAKGAKLPRAVGPRLYRGLGACPHPQKMLKFRDPEMPFPAFLVVFLNRKTLTFEDRKLDHFIVNLK